MSTKANSKAITKYYETLKTYAEFDARHEGAVETAFGELLRETGRTHGWTLIPKESMSANGHTIIPDGTMRDAAFRRGFWEAKDTSDDLDVEIKKKIAKGYPLTNSIFEDTREAVLYQNGREQLRIKLTDPNQLANLLNDFYAHVEPHAETFQQATLLFKDNVEGLAKGLQAIIATAHKDNRRFEEAYSAFFELCKTSLNPNISRSAVDEMLIQHLLTERLIRTIFDNPDFIHRNVIAVEIEKVIEALVSQSFSRKEYLAKLDRFYLAIEDSARGITEYKDKQNFLNVVYERFFQGYSKDIADTHGIVYTPQPIVDFMCSSVVEILRTEFGKELGDEDVVILDPATGTGNFIVNLLRRVPKRNLDVVYKDRLFANEIMLLPYYIAALNIEHTYSELSGHYEAFAGLCFVDTLELAEGAQGRFSFMTEKNSERVERQKKAPITVIIGNPPYNVGQANENDNNKNRKYAIVDQRIKDTYAKNSKASNVNKLSDAYVKFFRSHTKIIEQGQVD